MAVLSFVVNKRFDGERLDTFLRQSCNMSGTMIKRSKFGGLTMDGNFLRTIDPVREGAVVCVDTGEQERQYNQCLIYVECVYEDSNLIVYNKPSNMPSHPSISHQDDTLCNVFAVGKTTSGLTYRPINRLDKDTTGLVFVAKNKHAASYYAKRINKTYLAMVHGIVTKNSGIINEPIEREHPDSFKRTVRSDGQQSVTEFTVKKRMNDYSLVEFNLLTGRTHQIRVHMSHIGHPLLGDTLYGGDCSLIERQALHCHRGQILLESNRLVDVIANYPEDFKQLF